MLLQESLFGTLDRSSAEETELAALQQQHPSAVLFGRFGKSGLRLSPRHGPC